jgi:hypothetical protein
MPELPMPRKLEQCREASLKVLARLDIGVQEIHMVSEEKVELLLYSLQQLGPCFLMIESRLPKDSEVIHHSFGQLFLFHLFWGCHSLMHLMHPAGGKARPARQS